MPPEENKKEINTEEESVEVAEPAPPEEAPAGESVSEFPNPESVSSAPAEQAPEVSPEIVEPETPSEVAPTQTEPPQPQPQQPEVQVREKIVFKTDPNFVQELLVKARAAIQTRKQKKLDKIIALFDTNPQITNKDIQKSLRVSSATAVRYLDILEKENRIKQVGNTGKSVFYTKI